MKRWVRHFSLHMVGGLLASQITYVYLLPCVIGRGGGREANTCMSESDLKGEVLYKEPCSLFLASVIKQRDVHHPHCLPPPSILNRLQPNCISYHVMGIRNPPMFTPIATSYPCDEPL